MRKLLAADLFRLLHSKWLWLCVAGMLAVSAAFTAMQYTAMDYTVPLSRVIFLPVSFYGLAMAAFVSMFVGEDIQDGFIRNKLLAARSRTAIFASSLAVCALAGLLVYLAIVAFTTFTGRFLFANDLTAARFAGCLLLGLGMCAAYACVYCTVAMLCRTKATAAVLCMGLAFFMLFACLHTNQVMVQQPYKNGAPNPAYLAGFAKSVYAFLHDLNPCGQAAQLAAMQVFCPARFVLCDVLWVLAAVGGSRLFGRKNIR